MQSGRGNGDHWVLQFAEPASRAIEPLMGGTSTDTTHQQVTLRFPSKESAVAYAIREGYAYEVHDPPPRRVHPKAYADNFRYDRIGRWTH